MMNGTTEKMTVDRTTKLEILIVRPGGVEERVDITAKWGNCTDAWFKKNVYPAMVAETKKAGRGDIIRYERSAATAEVDVTWTKMINGVRVAMDGVEIGRVKLARAMNNDAKYDYSR
jgi:hypothetical protein